MNFSDPKDIGFTSDYHLYHRNIINLSKRPFDSILEMNERIRDNHNAVFDNGSIIFNLGDALLLPKDMSGDSKFLKSVENLLRTFKGKIYYLPGNHERHLNLINTCWEILPQYQELTLGIGKKQQHIILCHYALRTWNRAHCKAWHLHGHSHGGLVNDYGERMQDYKYTLSMDVGVDTNNYKPYTFSDVKKFMSSKEFRSDNHLIKKI